MAKIRTCFEHTIASNWVIKLEQRGKDNFRVSYGADVKDNLTHNAAALQLGAVIMHALACEDKLDNRRKHER